MYFSPGNRKADDTVNRFINDINQKKAWACLDRSLDDHYLMSRDFYHEEGSVLEEIPAVCLLQTALIFPFYIPLESKPFTIPFHALKESRAAVTVFLSAVPDEVTFAGGFVPEKAVRYTSNRTRCEVLVSFIDDTFILGDDDAVSVLNVAKYVQARVTKDGNDDDWVRATGDMFKIYRRVVERSLAVLNSIVMAYAVENEDDRVHPVTVHEIEPVSHFRIIEPDTWTTYNWMAVHHMRWPGENPPVLDDSAVAQVYQRSAAKAGNYFEVYEEQYQRALYEYQAGRVSIAILLLAVSVEVLVKKIIRLDRQEKERIDEAELDTFIVNLSLKQALPTAGKILGGNWDITGDSIVGRWFNTAYSLRNRVAHAGYEPDDDEVGEAIGLTSEFHAFVRQRISRKPKKLKHLVAGFKTPHVWKHSNVEVAR